MLRTLIFILVSLYSMVASAGWIIDPEGSYVGFASVKNDLIAENHSFMTISGGVSDAGQAKIEIPLAGVETMIPLRNERMQSMLFQTGKFPSAIITSQIPLDQLTTLEPGEFMTLTIELNIDLHGTQLTRGVLVKVMRSSVGAYEVSSLGPIVVHAAQFTLSDGVEALRKIAGLQSIDLMVPVTFDLRFVLAE